MNRPITSAEWAQPLQSISRTRVRRESCVFPGVFSAAKAAPFTTYESSQMSGTPPTHPSPLPPSLHLPSHSFHSRVAREEGGAASALSDESDNQQRCFGSGDTALAKHSVCVCVCVYALVRVRRKKRRREER